MATSIQNTSVDKNAIKTALKNLKTPQKELFKAQKELVSIAQKITQVNRDSTTFQKISLIVMSVIFCWTIIAPYKAFKAWMDLDNQKIAREVGRIRITQNYQTAFDQASEVVNKNDATLAKAEQALRTNKVAASASVVTPAPAAKPAYAWYWKALGY